MLPCEVSKIAYVPAGLLIIYFLPSASNYRTRAFITGATHSPPAEQNVSVVDVVSFPTCTYLFRVSNSQTNGIEFELHTWQPYHSDVSSPPLERQGSEIRNFRSYRSVGKALALELAKKRADFRVVARSEESLRRHFRAYEPLVEYCVADLADPVSAARAAADVGTIFYTVGVPYTQFQLHPILTRIALEAATAARVSRFVHVSTVYPYGIPQSDLVDESHLRNPSAFKGRMRKEQEDLVLAADTSAGMRTVILRPPDFYGPDAELSYARSIFDAAVKGGTANVIGPVDAPHEFIFVPDLAETLVSLSEKTEAYGQAWNVAGPGVITTRQFAELVFGAVHQKTRIRAAGKFVLRVLGLFNPLMREVVEMHYLWTTPVILDDRRLRKLLPDLKKTSYAEGIKITIKAMNAAA